MRKAEEEAILRVDNTRVRQLKKEIEEWREKEATMWAQRSRLLWAKQGDKNSKYFHSCDAKRYWKNLIEGLRDGEASWKTNQENISEILVSYYQARFSSSGHMESSRVWECVPNVITDEMNALLGRQFEAHGVAVALQQMAPLKALSPDGMPPLFYQHFWGTVRRDIISSILMWLNLGTLPHSLDHTFITLIPKTSSRKMPTNLALLACVTCCIKFFLKF